MRRAVRARGFSQSSSETGPVRPGPARQGQEDK